MPSFSNILSQTKFPAMHECTGRSNKLVLPSYSHIPSWTKFPAVHFQSVRTGGSKDCIPNPYSHISGCTRFPAVRECTGNFPVACITSYSPIPRGTKFPVVYECTSSSLLQRLVYYPIHTFIQSFPAVCRMQEVSQTD